MTGGVHDVDTTVAVPRNPATGQFVLTRKTLQRQCRDMPAPAPKRYGPVSLLERHIDQCAWLGDDGLCCGRLVHEQSYCFDHYWEAHR